MNTQSTRPDTATLRQVVALRLDNSAALENEQAWLPFFERSLDELENGSKYATTDLMRLGNLAFHLE
ncbi:MAG: hypothetical protein D6800_14370, partial [Candidatus Zixiibacteriota bacterium]